MNAEAFWRIRAAAARLWHTLGHYRVTKPGLASAECCNPGCNMGLSVDLFGYPNAKGAAVTHACAGRKTP